MAKLPTVSSNIPRDLRQFLDRVREALDGEQLTPEIKKALLESGFALAPDGTLIAPSGQAEYGTPPAPLNLQTQGFRTNVLLTWDEPVYPGHSYAEVWVAPELEDGTAPEVESATLIGMAPGTTYTHVIEGSDDTVWWYWVRFVNLDGVQGPYDTVSGTQGQSEYLTPPTPTGLTTEGRLSSIFLAWDEPTYPGHFYTEIWAAPETTEGIDPGLDAAERIGMAPGGRYIHGTSEIWWYWVRFVNLDGVAGPYNAVGGTRGRNAYATPPAPANLQTEGALANVILTWDQPTYEGHSHTEIWAAQALAGGGTPDIGEAVLVGMSPGTVYAHNLGSDATRWYWVRFVNRDGLAGPYNAVAGTRGDTGQDPAYLISLLEGQISESELAESLGTQITTTRNDLDALDASLNAEITTTRNDLDALDASLDALRGGWAGNLDGFLADRTPTLTLADLTAVSDDIANIYATQATLTTDYYTIAEADQAISAATTTLKSEIEDPNGTSLGATLEQDYYTSVETDSAISAQTTALESSLQTYADNAANAAEAGAVSTVTATLEQDYYTSVETDSAISSAATTLKSQIEDPNGNSVGAALQTEATTRAQETGDLFAQYTVKTDLNGYVSGYGLASTSVNGVPSSEFIIRSDSFAIGAPGGTTPNPSYPFIVRTTPTIINGETVPAGAYIKDAFIQNGTITKAKIADAAIDNAKIADLNAEKITAGTLDADRIEANSIDGSKINTNFLAAKLATITDAYIDTANIADGAITNAQIADASITTAKIDTATITDLSSLTADIGHITAGKMQSPDGRFVIDLDQKIIRITV